MVEIVAGFLGYVSYHADAVLFRTGRNWRLWIEGEGAYRCEVLRAPRYDSPEYAELVYISEVKGDGSLLLMADGSIFEVDSYDTYTTGLWLGMSEGLLLGGDRLLNLDEGDEIISVTRLK